MLKRTDPKRSDPKRSDPKRSDLKRTDPKRSDPKTKELLAQYIRQYPWSLINKPGIDLDQICTG